MAATTFPNHSRLEKSPRNSNSVRRVLRVAQLAWEGSSAVEIADVLSMSPAAVYVLCSNYRIKLAPKKRNQFSFAITLADADYTRLTKIGARLGYDPITLVSRLAEVASSEPELVANLIDEADREAA